MNKRNVIVSLDDIEREIEIGVGPISGSEIKQALQCEERLCLHVGGSAGVLICDTDCLIILGNEKFFTDKSNQELPDNPKIEGDIKINLNGAEESFQYAKIAEDSIKGKDSEVPNGKLFAQISGGAYVQIEDGVRLVINNTCCFQVIPFLDDNGRTTIDIERCAQLGRKVPDHKYYLITVDRKKFTVDKRYLHGEEILGLVNKSPDKWALNQKFANKERRPISPNQKVDLAEDPCVERFETVPFEANQGNLVMGQCFN